MQFAQAFASRLKPELDVESTQKIMLEVFESLPPPDYSNTPLEKRVLQLVFRHDCQSLGCLDTQCVLCEHNPNRQCRVNFAQKYLVHDILKAKCDSPIRIEVIDRNTGAPIGEELPGVSIELCVLDGNQYDKYFSEMLNEECLEDLQKCMLTLNNKGNPLLVPGSGGSYNDENKVIVQLLRGTAVLPDLFISDSSEALLSGRKPPFRLIARAIPTDPLKTKSTFHIRSAVSEGFVVATRRTRNAGKVDIPNVDDHIGKLEHMGRETVRKLQDIRGSALAAGIDIYVPENRIVKVGEFRKLALLAEADGHLRQKLQQVLKLSKEKWEEARDHAMRAVVADNRMRIWYSDKKSLDTGLLFACRLGNIDLDRPVGLLTKTSSNNMQTTMEATLMAQQSPAQRDQVRRLQPLAEISWWQPGHPGWAIYPLDSEQFLSSGTSDITAPPLLETSSPPGSMLENGTARPSDVPFSTHSEEIVRHAIEANQTGSTSNFMRFLGLGEAQDPSRLWPINQANDSTKPSGRTQENKPESEKARKSFDDISPFKSSLFDGYRNQIQGDNAKAVSFSELPVVKDRSVKQDATLNQNENRIASVNEDQNRIPGDESLNHTSAFATVSSPMGKFDIAPSLNLGNLQAILGPEFRLGMSGLPSMTSGDLEAILSSHNAEQPGRMPSLMLGKMSSLDLPLPTPTANAQVADGRPDFDRRNSGLESMQSIEQALDVVDTQKRIMNKAEKPDDPLAAMDAAIAAVTESCKPKLSGQKRK